MKASTWGYALMSTGIAAATLTSDRLASAGRADVSPVTITISGTEGTAYGSLGSARNDIFDGNEYIRCESHMDQGSQYGSCAARKGTTAISCTFPIFAQPQYQYVLTNITSDSYVSFTWNTTTNVCDSLAEYMDSYDEPKLP